MPLLLIPLVLAALMWGAVLAFDAMATWLGSTTAIGLAAVAAVLLVAAIAFWVRRYREIAPNAHDDGWTHVVQRTWGYLRVSTTKGLLWLSQNGVNGRYTLSDLGACRVEIRDERWYLIVAVRDAEHAEWTLPMRSKRDALRWARVLTLAKQQRL
ncbi:MULTISPECIES: hypothetical protein [Burkholderia]|uniref:hypothetical protein n=1 Tax=Burkholderia TaxID=32008 RepID=UPI00084173CC|nr:MULTISPECIES: hypothetical protein [unclassified Burkholderia]AOK32513.1 signal peptide protein [Burkholderia sp. Bp7605]